MTAGTKLDDYIDEVRSGYDDEQRARLDAVMRHYDVVGRQLERRLDAESLSGSQETKRRLDEFAASMNDAGVFE